MADGRSCALQAAGSEDTPTVLCKAFHFVVCVCNVWTFSKQEDSITTPGALLVETKGDEALRPVGLDPDGFDTDPPDTQVCVDTCCSSLCRGPLLTDTYTSTDSQDCLKMEMDSWIRVLSECLQFGISDLPLFKCKPMETRKLGAYDHMFVKVERVEERPRIAIEVQVTKKEDVSREETLLKVIALNPTSVEAHSNYGILLELRGDFTGAEKALLKAISLDPVNAKAHTNYGLLLDSRGDVVGAEKALLKAIALDPSITKAHTNYGILLKSRGDMAGAEKAFLKAIALDPLSAKAHNNYGVFLLSRGDMAGAEKEYRHVIRLDPADTSAWANLAAILYQNRDFVAARVAAQTSVMHQPNNDLANEVLKGCAEC